nr:uncharacterized protein LOC120976495 [Aegilops tauschii subsp. strangulata]
MASGSASPGSVSSRLCPVVSGLGLSASSGSASSTRAIGAPLVPAPPAAAGAAAPWRRSGPSRKALWRKRKAFQKQTATGRSRPRSPSSSLERREIPPDLFGLCFKCFREGHRRDDCTFPPLCIRCGLEGHIFTECKRPRSPRSEEDLRREALAKVARTALPLVPAGIASRLSPATRQASPQEGPSSVPGDTAPVDFGLAVASNSGAPCILLRTPEIDDLERRLQLAVVAYVGGPRPPVSCQDATEAISV